MAVYNTFKYSVAESCGVTVKGRIISCDYNPHVKYNHKKGVVYTILIGTKKGSGILRYDMHGPYAPYKKGELVNLKVYKDYVLLAGKYTDTKVISK